MCQKASGGPFMAFVRFPAQNVVWTTMPDTFENSSAVERGFCKRCGTPLTYRRAGGRFVSITLNSLDDPEAAQPELSFAADKKAHWLQSLAGLPNEAMELITVPGFISHQVP